MLERKFQSNLIKILKEMFPNSIILKNDPIYKQGIPDLIILENDKWATLECKQKSNSKAQPNQKYYVDKMNGMSFSKFISKDNQEEVLYDLERFFKGV